MARVFSIPIFLAIFLLGMKFLCAPTHAHAATAADDGNTSLWKSIHDYEDKYAFDQYGPPIPQNRAKFEGETQLYESMVQDFDLAAEDEYDFTFIVDAYDVPVDVFRPDVIRPGEAVKESEDNPFGEDDPLPESVQSTSSYVEEIRPTFLPGPPLKQHSAEEVKLGNAAQGSLFTEKPAAPPALAAAAGGVAAPDATAKPLPGSTTKAGATDVPKGPKPGSDEETLANLKAAVKELGLERKLNLDPSQKLGSGVDAPKPTTPPDANNVKPAPVAAPPVAVAPKAAPHVKVKKKRALKKRRAHRAIEPNSDDGIVTQQIPIENNDAPQAAPENNGDDN